MKEYTTIVFGFKLSKNTTYVRNIVWNMRARSPEAALDGTVIMFREQYPTMTVAQGIVFDSASTPLVNKTFSV
jgi:hypothetical protein